MFELFYSTGGHGGPYRDLLSAKLQALRLLAGNISENYIKIVRKKDNKVISIVTRTHLHYFDLI